MAVGIRTPGSDPCVLQVWLYGNSKWHSSSCAATWIAGGFAGNHRHTSLKHLVPQAFDDTFGLRPRFLGSVSNGL